MTEEEIETYVLKKQMDVWVSSVHLIVEKIAHDPQALDQFFTGHCDAKVFGVADHITNEFRKVFSPSSIREQHKKAREKQAKLVKDFYETHDDLGPPVTP